MVAGMRTISDLRFQMQIRFERRWLTDRRTGARVLLFGFFLGLRLARFAADHGDAAGADELEDAVGPHPLNERLDFALAAGNLDHQLLGSHIDNAGPKDL